MNNFEKWDKEFRKQNLYEFNNNSNGLLWLKVRAVCRSSQIKLFEELTGIYLYSKKIKDQNMELFEVLQSRQDGMTLIDNFLRDRTHEWYTRMNVDTNQLKEDLYKVQYYTWGGDQNNSLDKFLIGRYVKTISNFKELQALYGDIATNAWNYVQNSWYNNWTSYLIESIFKKNPAVISAVGEIKSVDFFIGGYPLDLKVTFFPHQFMEQKFKTSLGKSSLVWLKSKCKNLNIFTDSKASTNQQIYSLTEKLKEYNQLSVLSELQNIRREIISEAETNPYELITWLYENQGEMRFGAENRLYLILSDICDFENSWKLKRAFSLIEPKIETYINEFSDSSLKKIRFSYKGLNYNTFSDTIFITK